MTQRLTALLFYEPWLRFDKDKQTQQPRFSLNEDLPGLICFGKKYVSLMDKTGYKVSKLLLEDFKHFQKLLLCDWFKRAKVGWDNEIDAILEQEQIANLRKIAASEDKGALAAIKTLLVYTGKDKPSPTRGRPSKSEVQGNLKQTAEDERTLNEDIERLKLVK